MSELDFKPYKAIVPGAIYRGIPAEGAVPIVMLSRFKYPSLAQGVEYVQDAIKRFKQTQPISCSEDLQFDPVRALEFIVSRLPEEVRKGIISGEKTTIGKLEQQFGSLGMVGPNENNYLNVRYGLVPTEDIKKNSGKPILHNRIFYERKSKEFRGGAEAFGLIFTIGTGLFLPNKGRIDSFFENPKRTDRTLMVDRGDFYDFHPIRKMTDLIYENMPDGSIELVKDITPLRLQTLVIGGMQSFLEKLSIEAAAANLAGTLAGGLAELLIGKAGTPNPSNQGDKPKWPKSDSSGSFPDAFAV